MKKLDRRIPNIFADVKQFAELAQADLFSERLGVAKLEAIMLAIKLVEEECNKEYIPALHKFMEAQTRENLVAVIDGAINTIYVVAWALAILKVPAEAAWNEVQRSNMDKFPIAHPMYGGCTNSEYTETVEFGRVIRRNSAFGKVMKPDGWTPPDLHTILHEFETIEKMRAMPDYVATDFFREYFHTTERRHESGED